jgi:hypothetical protein
MAELRNHFKEALGKGYIDNKSCEGYSKRMNEIGYLMNRIIKGIQKARDSFEEKKKLERNSRRSLPGLRSFLAQEVLASKASQRGRHFHPELVEGSLSFTK